MAPVVQKAASATILSFLGSSFILGIAIFLMKDTMDRVNKTIENVNHHNEQMITLDGSIINLNYKLDDLGKTVIKTANVLEIYTKDQSASISNMSISMVRVTEKLISVDGRCDTHEKDLREHREYVRGLSISGSAKIK